MTDKTFDKLVGKKVINKKTKEIATVEFYAQKPNIGLSNGIGFCVDSPISKEWEEYKEENVEEFTCKVIETDKKRKERFALINRKNYEIIKNHNDFIPASDLFYIRTILRDKEVGFIIQKDWKLRLILEEIPDLEAIEKELGL